MERITIKNSDHWTTISIRVEPSHRGQVKGTLGRMCNHWSEANPTVQSDTREMPLLLPLTLFYPPVDYQGKDEQPEHEWHNDRSLNKANPIFKDILQIRQLCGDSQQDNCCGNDHSQGKSPQLKSLPLGVHAKTTQEHKTANGHQDKYNSSGKTMDRAMDSCLIQRSTRGIHYQGAGNKKKDRNDRKQYWSTPRGFSSLKLGRDTTRK
jgi:hypothetical protein